MAQNLSQGAPQTSLADRVANSREQVVKTRSIMQAITDGKHLEGVAAQNNISVAIAVRQIAVFNSQLMRFLEYKTSANSPDWKEKVFKKIEESTILTEDAVQKVPEIMHDILDTRARWSSKEILNYYELEADTLYYHLAIFGLRLLKEVEQSDNIDRGLAYTEIIFDAMAKCLNRMGTTNALRCAEKEQEDVYKQRLEDMFHVHNIHPPCNYLAADGRMW